MLRKKEQGFTILELLVVLGILGIVAGVGVWNYTKDRNPARETARTLHSELFRLRADAMANTQAQRLVLNADGTLKVQWALACNALETQWSEMREVQLPQSSGTRPVTIATATTPAAPAINVVACFTPRGIAAKVNPLTITDTKSRFLIQIALGGGVKTSAY